MSIITRIIISPTAVIFISLLLLFICPLDIDMKRAGITVMFMAAVAISMKAHTNSRLTSTHRNTVSMVISRSIGRDLSSFRGSLQQIISLGLIDRAIMLTVSLGSMVSRITMKVLIKWLSSLFCKSYAQIEIVFQKISLLFLKAQIRPIFSLSY